MLWLIAAKIIFNEMTKNHTREFHEEQFDDVISIDLRGEPEHVCYQAEQKSK